MRFLKTRFVSALMSEIINLLSYVLLAFFFKAWLENFKQKLNGLWNGAIRKRDGITDITGKAAAH